MSIEVLSNSNQNDRARSEMRRLGVDFATPKVIRALRKFGLVKGISIGDRKKSWDVLKTVQFLQKYVSKDGAILDIGAFASEIVCVLHTLGYSKLSGLDLNPKISLMPHSGAVNYVVGDFTETSFPDGTFDAVTAISVLEHGFRGPKVFAEMSRILKPSGYFVGSVDYWPEKIDTSGMKLFGVDWKIFSKDELLELIEEGKRHGLSPVGEFYFRAGDKVVNWSGRKYTFAWFAFQKTRTQR